MLRWRLTAAVVALTWIFGCSNANLVGGRNYVDQGVYDKAVDVLEKAVVELPDNPEAHYLLGKSYVKTDQFENAATELARAAELDPFYAERADTVQQDAYAKLFNSGNEFLAAGQYSEARDRFVKAALFRPNEIGVHQNLGFVYTKLGRRDDAIESYRRMHAINPEDMSALRTVLGILSDAGERKQAYQVCEEILANKPDDLSILGLLADMHYEDADSAQARGDVAEEEMTLRKIIPLYEKVVSADPGNIAAIYQLGLVNYRLGDFTEAASYFENALDTMKPDNSLARDALYNLAVSLFKTKQFVMAEIRFRELIEQEPKQCEHYRLLSATLREQRRQSDALDAVRQYEECKQGR